LLIDEVLKIDFPPDTWHHIFQHGLDLCKVRDMLFTHSHPDHLNAGGVYMRMPSFSHGCETPLRVYGNDAVLRDIRARIAPCKDTDRALIPLNLIRPFVTVRAETCVFTPLPADHFPLETCLLFHI